MLGKDFSVKVFADGADINGMLEMYHIGFVKGFTTNPTLMKKAGVTNYEEFARAAIKAIPDLPLSFEVFSDDFQIMEKEAKTIGGWGNNVYIKIPVTNTLGESSVPLIKKLSSEGFRLNITAILTLKQVEHVLENISSGSGAFLSVFAGRIADTGVDPMPLMRETVKMCKNVAGAEIIWASTRELLNIFQAEECGVDIITVTNDILKKMSNVGKDLNLLSLETVQMFYNDAKSLGYKIVL
jgi:transaldolase